MKNYLRPTGFVNRAVVSAILFNLLILTGAVNAATWHPLVNGEPAKPAIVEIIEETSDHISLRWEFSGIYTQEVEMRGGRFTRIGLSPSQLSYSGDAGSPALPIDVSLIRLPQHSKGRLIITGYKWHEIGSWKLAPVQIPLRDEDSTPPPFAFDEIAYQSKEVVPSEIGSVSNTMGWGGVPIAGVSVIPLRYQASTGNLQLASTITARIDFIPANTGLVRPHTLNPRIIEIQEKTLLNPLPIDPRILDVDENEPVRILFVLREEALENVQPLIEFHHSTGLRTDVYLADDLEGPEELKEVVREYFIEGLQYLFIIGDAYRFDWDVPMFQWDPIDPVRNEEDRQPNTDPYSDTWYICLDDPDEDGFEDHIPDLAVGRLTYDEFGDVDENGDPTDLRIQVEKLVKYLTWNFENRDDVNWLGRAILVASNDRVEGERLYLECKQAIETFDYGRNHPDFITAYGTDRNVTPQTVVDVINDDGVGFFNYRGHGTDLEMDGWSYLNQDIDDEQVQEMENSSRPFVLVSSACRNGSVAERRSDCLLEFFQKHDGGSVVAHGSTISTFTDGNSFFDRRIYEIWFDVGLYDLGYAENMALAEMVVEFDPTRWPCIGRMNTRAYIWLGDPALEYRLNAPLELVITAPDTIVTATEWINVNVQSNGEGFEGARVTVRSENDDVYQVALTGEDGVARIDFNPGIGEPGLLMMTAYYRDAYVAFDTILVADGFGALAGRVSDAENDSAIQDAELELSPFNVVTYTDVEGNFFIESLPQREYTLTVSAEGYLRQQLAVAVGEDDTTIVNIEMLYALLVTDSNEISLELAPQSRTTMNIELSNTGNGPLDWTAYLRGVGVTPPYELLNSIEVSLELDDNRLNGVVFVNGSFYICGGNNNGEPNYIYIVDEDGRMTDRFEQVGSAGIGYHDLAWDGQYLYASSNNSIKILTLDGELAGEIAGPHFTNTALAIDGDGNLWVANHRDPLVKIDRDGNQLDEIGNDYPVRALAWYPEAADGFNLMMLVRGDDNRPRLYQANPETGQVQYTANLDASPDDIPADGLFVTRSYFPAEWTLIGMINNDILRYIRIWHLGFMTSWLSLEPESGQIPPGEDDVVILSFDSDGFDHGTDIETAVILENNGRTPQLEIPVILRVRNGAVVDPGSTPNLPGSFYVNEIYPNPFNSNAKITFSLPKTDLLRVSLHDLQGREIRLIVDGVYPPGEFSLTVSSDQLASGIYLLVFEAGNNRQIRKLTVLR